jgi:Tfp pilus assembly protein PilN
MHNLTRGQRLALTLLLSVAVLLPLFALLPRYINWEFASRQKDSVDRYTASASDSFN